MKTNLLKNIITKVMIATLIVTAIPTMTYANETVGFSDIEGHWGEEYINYMVKNDISKGYPDGTYKPDNTINVDEFLTLCVKSIPNQVIENNGQSSYWATPYIQYALEEQIIGEKEFINFQRPITREEMSLIAIRTLSKTKVIAQQSDIYLINNIHDYHLIDDYYKQDVLDSYAVGLITGKPNNQFDPKGTATRAESAVVIVRLLEEEERMPLEFTDIPSTTAYYTSWTDKGWKDIPVTLYAPLNSDGEPVSDVVDIYEYFYNESQTPNKNIKATYNPHENVTAVDFYPNDEYKKLTDYQSDIQQLQEISYFASHMGVNYEEYPYSISFKSYPVTYEYINSTYGEYLDYLYNYFFEDEKETIKAHIKRIMEMGEKNYDNAINETFKLKNGRTIFIGSDRGFVIEIGIKK